MKYTNPHTMARWELAATVEPGKVVEVARIVRDRNHRLGEALDRDVKASQTTPRDVMDAILRVADAAPETPKEGGAA